MNLIKRIGIYTVVGFLLLAFTPECKKRYDNRCLRKAKYNRALEKTQDLADTNNNGKLDKTEWRAIKVITGINLHSRRNLKLRHLDDYLNQRGFYWNGKNYIEK